MARVELSGVTKDFSDGVRAVDELSLEIEDGEFVVLVGPSGCGKTTALRMIAGLESVTDGVISIDGRVVNDVPSAKRDVAMVFQNYALYPHMTVFENMAFGLQQRRMPKREIEAHVVEIARLLELEPYLKRKPRALSGGQRQRVAMGRAIVRHPSVFLMDEPLSNLDAKLRVQMRGEIHDLQRRLGVTTLYVTHDQVEAMTLGDRVAVMLDGQLQQVAPPQALYERPVNEFVAGFIGSPSINIVEAELARSNGGLAVSFGGHRLAVDDAVVRARPALEGYVGRTVLLGIRPEHLEDAALQSDAPPDRRLRTTCELTEPLGAEMLVHFTVSAPVVVTGVGSDADPTLGAAPPGSEDGAARLVARVDPRSKITESSEIELAVDTSRLYFFDPDSREAV